MVGVLFVDFFGGQRGDLGIFVLHENKVFPRYVFGRLFDDRVKDLVRGVLLFYSLTIGLNLGFTCQKRVCKQLGGGGSLFGVEGERPKNEVLGDGGNGVTEIWFFAEYVFEDAKGSLSDER